MEVTETVLPEEVRPRKREKGLALIMVLSLIAVIMAVVADIIFQSEITSRTAVGERDRMRAEVSALTGAQFAKMLILLDSAILSLPPEVKKLVGSQLGSLKLFSLMDGMPIGGEIFEGNNEVAQKVSGLFSSLDEKLVAAIKSVPGYFVIKTIDESGKLNVNMAAKPELKDAIKDSLTRLFSTPREARFLDDKGYPPKRLVANIVDYLDKNSTDELDGTDEEAQYRTAKFTHKPKNGPLESTEELRRIPGFHDDEIYNLFSPYLTVWPMVPEERSFNINTAPTELLAALSTTEGNEINDTNIDTLEDYRAEKKQVEEQRAISDFFDQTLRATNSNNQKRIATIETKVFRVEVRGVSNGVERTYVMVIDRSKPKGQTKAPPVRVIHQRFL